MSSNFWETIWQILVVFVLVAYLIVLFQIIVDLFRDKKLGGFSKAIWFLGLIFVPIFTALLYILFRGRGMSERQIEAVKEARAETDAYIRSVAGSKSPTEQIAEAKSLLDSGAISADESRLIKNVERKNRELGAFWGWVLALYERFRTGEWLDPSERISVEWHDPATPTIAQRMDATVKAKQVGILSQEGTWDELGWSEARKAKERAYFDAEYASDFAPIATPPPPSLPVSSP